MILKNNYHQSLEPGKIYHLFSRAVGKEKLFIEERNYHFFLDKLKQFTSSICDVYVYCLLPNHFHLLVRIKEENEIVDHFEKVKSKSFNNTESDLSDFIMERFSNFLNSYTKSFNKLYNRKGALFMDYLKRSKVSKKSDFTNYVWYIHKNPVHHHLVKYVGEWKYDSYPSILSNAPTALLRDEVLEWFGSKQAFLDFHKQKIYPKNT